METYRLVVSPIRSHDRLINDLTIAYGTKRLEVSDELKATKYLL
jgi:hypothetical protein